MFKSYLVIVILAIFFIIATYYNGFNNNLLREFSPNLASEIIGILLVVFFIERIINNNKKREEQNRLMIALNSVRGSLIKQLHFLMGMWKASSTTIPQLKGNTVDEIFNNTFFCAIEHLDFSKEYHKQVSFITYGHKHQLSFKKDLEKLLEKYVLCLDIETVSLIEKLLNSPFINILINIKKLERIDKKEGYKRDYTILSNGNISILREYIKLISQLVTIFNENCQQDKRIELDDYKWIWREDVAPHLGTCFSTEIKHGGPKFIIGRGEPPVHEKSQ